MIKIFDTIMGDPYLEFTTYICIGYIISSAVCWWTGFDEIPDARDIIIWVSLVIVVFPRLGERK